MSQKYCQISITFEPFYRSLELAQAACVRHPRLRLQCVAGHCYYQLSVFLFRLLLLTHFGETPKAENLFPQYFSITRRYKQNKYFILRATPVKYTPLCVPPPGWVKLIGTNAMQLYKNFL